MSDAVIPEGAEIVPAELPEGAEVVGAEMPAGAEVVPAEMPAGAETVAASELQGPPTPSPEEQADLNLVGPPTSFDQVNTDDTAITLARALVRPPETPEQSAEFYDKLAQNFEGMAVQRHAERRGLLTDLARLGIKDAKTSRDGIEAIVQATGAPIDTVERNYEEFKGLKQLIDLDPDKFLREHSGLFELMTENPHLAGATITSADLSLYARLQGGIRAWEQENPYRNLGLKAIGPLGIPVKAMTLASDMVRGDFALTPQTYSKKSARSLADGDFEKLEGFEFANEMVMDVISRSLKSSELSSLQTDVAFADAAVRAALEHARKLGWSDGQPMPEALQRALDNQWDLRRQVYKLEEELGPESHYGDSELMRAATGAIQGTASSVGFLAHMGVGYAAGAAVGLIAGGAATIATGGATAELVLPLAGYLGTIGGSAYSFFKMTRETMGPDYWRMLREGADPSIAFKTSLATGMLSAGIETAESVMVALPAMGVSTRLMLGGRGAAKAAERSMFGAVSRELSKDAILGAKTFGGTARRLVVDGLTQSMGEGAEETAQSVVSDGGVHTALSLTKGEFLPLDTNSILLAADEAGWQGMLGGMAMGATSASVRLVSHQLEWHKAMRAGDQIATIAQLKDSPLVRAAPKAVARMLIEKSKGDRPIEGVFVDPLEVAKRGAEAGLGVEQLGNELMGEGGGKRLQDALASRREEDGRRATLRLELDEYLTRWGTKGIAEELSAHTTAVAAPNAPTPSEPGAAPATQPLEAHMTTAADTMTPAELAAAEVVHADTLKAKSAQILAQLESGLDLAPRGEGEHQFVKQLQRQLLQANVKPAAARQQIAAIRAMVETTAARIGKPIDDLYALNAIRIARVVEKKMGVTSGLSRPAASKVLSQKLRDMDLDEKAALLYLDENTGTFNERWFLEQPATPERPFVAHYSFEGTKWKNEENHTAGNLLYRTFGQAIAKVTADGAKWGGDFVSTVASPEEAQANALRMRDIVRDALRAANPKMAEQISGLEITAVAVPRGENVADAVRAAGQLNGTTKADLENANRRAKRGAKPFGVPVAEGKDLRLSTEPAPQQTLSDYMKQRAAALTDEEIFNRVYLDKGGKILSREGFFALPRAKHVVSIDLNGLKALNDLHGTDFGDILLETFMGRAQLAGGSNFAFAHLSGDEFALQADDIELVQTFIDILGDLADNVELTTPKGDTYAAITFGYGIGPDYDTADGKVKAHKARGAAAERSARRNRAEDRRAGRSNDRRESLLGGLAPEGFQRDGQPLADAAQEQRSLVERLRTRLTELLGNRLDFYEAAGDPNGEELAYAEIFGPIVNFDVAESFEAGHIKDTIRRLGEQDTQDLLEGSVLSPRQVAEGALSAEGQATAQRIVDAIEQQREGQGPSVDAEVVLPPNVRRLNQVQNIPQWEADVTAWMKAQVGEDGQRTYSDKDVKKHLAAMRGQMAIFSALGPVQLRALPKGVNKAEGPAWAEGSKNEKGEAVAGKGVGERVSDTPHGPMRKNQDPIYLLSFDLSAMCVKRLEASATAAYIERKLMERAKSKGKDARSLTSGERMALVALFKQAGKSAPCLYCYVEAPRNNVGTALNEAAGIIFGRIEIPTTWSPKTVKMAKDAINDIKTLGIEQGDVELLAFTDPDYAQRPAVQAKMATAPALYKFLGAVANSKKANQPKLYEEYTSQILHLSTDFIEDMNSAAGFRFFSSSDFQFEHMADLMQAFFDLSLRKAKSHAYTKVVEYVDIFGATGQKIQTSTFSKPAGIVTQLGDKRWAVLKYGTQQVLQETKSKDAALKWLDNYMPEEGFSEDTWQGMGWKDAQRLSKKHANVGTVFIATSRAQIRWAMKQPWIHYIIPFHASGMMKEMFNELAYTNFTGQQGEKWIEPDLHPKLEGKVVENDDGQFEVWSKGKKAKGDKAEVAAELLKTFDTQAEADTYVEEWGKPKIRMHQLDVARGAAGLSAEEFDLQKGKEYLELCKDKGIRPVFEEFAYIEEEGKKKTVNPGYFKLKKDYARTDTSFDAVQPKFDLKAASRALDTFFAGGAAKAKVDKRIAKTLLDLIDKAPPGHDIDFGPEAVKAVNEGRDIAAHLRAKLHPGTKRLEQGEYRGSHKAPGPSSGAPLNDLTGGGQVYPDDVYSPQAARYYGHGGSDAKLDAETIRILHALRGKPDAEVTVYRALPIGAGDTINAGDWVTVNRQYAMQHGKAQNSEAQPYHVIEKKVRASEVFTNGDSIHEAGYWPGGKEVTREQRSPDKKRRGFVDMMSEGMRKAYKILLTENADMSTFLHETAHVYLDMLGDLVELQDTPASLKKDHATILQWLGAKDHASLTDAQHEDFARGFEAYLMEGKAPSLRLVGAFTAFRVWMLKLYGSARGLNIELDDNIRGAFDRMLATDKEIEQMRAAMGVDKPIFRSPEEAGMSAQDYLKYLDKMKRSTARAAIRAQQQIFKVQQRTASAMWKAEVKANKAKAEAEFDARPDAKAWRYLLKGETVTSSGAVFKDKDLGKLNRDAVRKIVRPGILGFSGDTDFEKALRGRLVKGGESPAAVAKQFGFKSGKALIDALMKMPDREQMVAAQAEARTLQANPDLADTLRDLAAKALHNDDTVEFLTEELRELRKKAITVVNPETGAEVQISKSRLSDAQVLAEFPEAAFKLAAKDLVGKSTIQRLNVQHMLGKEQAASNNAMLAAGRGEFKRALLFKQEQMLYTFAFMELEKVSEERRQFDDLLKATGDKTRRGALGLASKTFLGASDSILEALGLRDRPTDAETLSMRKTWPEVAMDLANFGMTAELPFETLSALPSSVGALTVNQMRDVKTALTMLYTAARQANSITLEGKQVALDEMADAIWTEASRLKHLGKAPASLSSKVPKGVVARRDGWFAGWNAVRTTPEQMMRELGDRAHKFFFRGFLSARQHEQELATTVGRPIFDAWEKVPKALRKGINEPLEDLDGVELDEALGLEGAARDRAWMIMVALNTGNRSNLDRLLGGYGWDETRVRDWLNRNMSKEEWEFVQGIWDVLDKQLYPHVAAAYEKANGIKPDKIPAEAFTVKLPSGETIEMRGGYFPAKYDPRVSRRGQEQSAEDVARLYGEGAGRMSVAKSFTQGRAAKYTDVINLQWGVVPGHMSQVIHYIAFDQFQREAGRLYSHGTTQQAIKQYRGEKVNTQIKAWLQTTASANADAIPVQLEDAIKPLLKVRSAYVASTIGYSVAIASGDLSNPVFSMAKLDISPWHLAKATREMLWRGRKIAKGEWDALFKESRDKSTELTIRASNMRDLLRKNLTDIGKGGTSTLESIRDTAWLTMELSDALTSTVVWQAAYRQYQDKGLSESEAILRADERVRAIMPSHDPAMQPALLRDKRTFGVLVAFHGFFNTVYNAQREVWFETLQRLQVSEGFEENMRAGLGVAKAAAVTLAMWTVSSALGEWASGRGPEDDEDWGEWYLRKMLAAPFMSNPFLSGAGEAVANYIVDPEAARRPFSMRGSPILSAGDRLYKIGKRALDAENDQQVADILEAFGFVTRTPTGSAQIQRTGRYLMSDQMGTGTAAETVKGLMRGPARD